MLRITAVLAAAMVAVLLAFNACESSNKDDGSDPDDNNTQQAAQSLIQDGKGQYYRYPCTTISINLRPRKAQR